MAQDESQIVLDLRASKSMMSYPDVIDGATHWAWSDEQGTKDGTIRVTEHGLRRLLRLAAKVFPVVHQLRLYTCGKEVPPHMFELCARECTPEILAELSNESASIWCEGNLVMSRLFVNPDGKIFAHPDKDVDEAAAPKSSKAESPL